MTKRVGEQMNFDDAVVTPGCPQLAEFADGGGAVARLAERGEIPEAQEEGRGVVQERDVDAVPQRDDVAALQWVGHLVCGQHPVGVAAPDGGKPCVEPVGGRGDATHDDVVG